MKKIYITTLFTLGNFFTGSVLVNASEEWELIETKIRENSIEELTLTIPDEIRAVTPANIDHAKIQKHLIRTQVNPKLSPANVKDFQFLWDVLSNNTPLQQRYPILRAGKPAHTSQKITEGVQCFSKSLSEALTSEEKEYEMLRRAGMHNKELKRIINLAICLLNGDFSTINEKERFSIADMLSPIANKSSLVIQENSLKQFIEKLQILVDRSSDCFPCDACLKTARQGIFGDRNSQEPELRVTLSLINSSVIDKSTREEDENKEIKIIDGILEEKLEELDIMCPVFTPVIKKEQLNKSK